MYIHTCTKDTMWFQHVWTIFRESHPHPPSSRCFSMTLALDSLHREAARTSYIIVHDASRWFLFLFLSHNFRYVLERERKEERKGVECGQSEERKGPQQLCFLIESLRKAKISVSVVHGRTGSGTSFIVSVTMLGWWLFVIHFLIGLLVKNSTAESLTPPYFNLAEGKDIIASATCGVDTPGPELYCKLVGANADQDEDINLIQGQVSASDVITKEKLKD